MDQLVVLYDLDRVDFVVLVAWWDVDVDDVGGECGYCWFFVIICMMR